MTIEVLCALPGSSRSKSESEVLGMSLDIGDLPIDLQGLDIDDLEIESLTTGLGMSEVDPVSCCSSLCSCCCCSST